jgi:putative Mn2+ efflux pump MntP
MFYWVFLGHKFGDLFQKKIEILGGSILIIIGTKILIEHLTAVPS